MKKIITFFALISSLSAFANEPMVVCGNEDPAGNTELNNITIQRGGNYYNQLVIRNSNIINYFLKTGAIYRDELNSNGEFVVHGGTDFDSHSNVSLIASVKNRHLAFLPSSNFSYRLVVTYTDSNYHDVVLADFTYNGCKTYLGNQYRRLSR